MLALKDYQLHSLEALRIYCQLTDTYADADTAYYQLSKETLGSGVPYNSIAELPGLPYVCIRIPTGGGKTLVACYAISILKDELLKGDHPLVIWLVPSNTIRDQTLSALRNPEHPYRQALEASLGSTNILDVSEALHIQRAALDSGSTIIVSTIQAFRVEDTDGRKVYANNGALMGHFDGFDAKALQGLEKLENGKPIYSLANVIRLRRPIVIVDEAHNARTDLSFSTLARLDPAAILELTATPDTEKNPSNVIYSVSAAQLQAEDMIKMPILLETIPDWKNLLSSAIAQLDDLTKSATAESRDGATYVRPIMLLQAQPNYSDRRSIAVEEVENTLINDFKIPKEQIVRATGTDRGLEGIDILAEDCPIRYVITVQALREGWDCPFAYVLCSVAEMTSSTAVEQLLGRIMRLPYAKRRKTLALNQAYAFAASTNFAATAGALVDGLVQNGFDRLEASELIRNRRREEKQLDLDSVLAAAKASEQSVSFRVNNSRFLDHLPSHLSSRMTLHEDDVIEFRGQMSGSDRDVLKSLVSDDQDKQEIEIAYQRSQVSTKRTPSENGIEFSLPRLAYKQGDILEELESTHFLEHVWSLSRCDASLDAEEFPEQLERGKAAKIIVSDEERVEVQFIENLQRQTTLLATDKGWTVAELVYWLDRAFPHPDIEQEETGIFLRRLVNSLMEERKLSLNRLVQDKYRLAKAARKKIDEHRQKARKEAFQQLLLPDTEPHIVVTPQLPFTYDPDRYPFRRAYSGRYEFEKHYYPQIGDLESSGEEFQCAQYLDTMDEVKHWVRNPDRSQLAFSLQTSTDRFYPDFVCELKDGRFLVVEYKGRYLLTNDDSKEKKDLGELWEKRSNGACLFLMVSDGEVQNIRSKISPLS